MKWFTIANFGVAAAKTPREKSEKYRGGIPFTYGPLAYFLKNRIYIGETHYAGKWFKGEHEAILDRPTFERVQELLKSNTVKRRTKFSESGAPNSLTTKATGWAQAFPTRTASAIDFT